MHLQAPGKIERWYKALKRPRTTDQSVCRALQPSSNRAKLSKERPPNIGACDTASLSPCVNSTYEVGTLLIYAVINAKCYDARRPN
jgi:hypothetical protein